MNCILYNRSTGFYEGKPQNLTSLGVFDLNRLLVQAGDRIRRWVPQMTAQPAKEEHHDRTA